MNIHKKKSSNNILNNNIDRINISNNQNINNNVIVLYCNTIWKKHINLSIVIVMKSIIKKILIIL